MSPEPSAAGEGPDSSRAMIAGLNAVSLLGSFMHAVGDAVKVADLAVGGLASLVRVPLVAVGWYEAGGGPRLRLQGSFAGRRALPDPVTEWLESICRTLPQHRPSSLDVVISAHPLRRAGVQEVLAVPLRVSNDCLGFLLAGGRRGAIPADLTLVQALGAQTSTALYVARVQAAETERAESLRQLSTMLARTLRLQEELIDLVLHGRDVGEVLAHLGHELEAPVWLLDPECQVVVTAAGGPQQAAAAVPGPAELRRALRPLRPGRGPAMVEMTDPCGDHRPFLAQRIAIGEDTFGYLLVGSTTLGPVDHGLLQGGLLVLALRLLVERSVAEAEERAGRELLADALCGRGGPRTALALAARLGHRDGAGCAVVLATRVHAREPAGGLEAARRLIAQEFAGVPQVLVGASADDVVAVARPEVADALAQRVAGHVAQAVSGVEAHVGISEAATDLAAGLEQAHREACAAAALALRSGVRVLHFGDLGLHKLIFDVTNGERIDEHVERWIGPLLRYDTEHGTRLRETLAQFLCGENQADTARLLSIHPSTLKYRLGRIRDVLGHDFTRPEIRFNIELALRLRDSREILVALAAEQT